MKRCKYVCAALAASLVLSGCAKSASSTLPETSTETAAQAKTAAPAETITPTQTAAALDAAKSETAAADTGKAEEGRPAETASENTAADKNTAVEAPSDKAGETDISAREYDIYSEMDGIVFGFMSGVGAWETMLYVKPDGSFNGQFNDANMGEIGEGYPNGTIYTCSFTGRFSEPEALSENTFKAVVEELNFDEYVDKEKTQDFYIEDGTRYILSSPYGLSANAEMEFYRPNTPVSSLTEDCISWNIAWFFEDSLPETIGEYAIYNVSDRYAFFPDAYAAENADASAKEDSISLYDMAKAAYAEQTMPVYGLLPLVLRDAVPDKPYESVTIKNLQGRWVNRYTNNTGSKIEEVLTVTGDRGKIESYADGVKQSGWNGEGSVSIEDRSDRKLCPAFRITDDDSGSNLCTIYIRWVKDECFYDGGFLNEWIYEPAEVGAQFSVTMDDLQGVWYTENMSVSPAVQIMLTVDGNNATLFETSDDVPDKHWNGAGKASLVLKDFSEARTYPELKIDMEEGTSKGITAGIYITYVNDYEFYDAGLGRWYMKITDY